MKIKKVNEKCLIKKIYIEYLFRYNYTDIYIYIY